MITLTPQQFASRLMTTSFSDGVTRTIRRGADGTVSVNMADLTASEQALARGALAEISALTGLRFSLTTAAGATLKYINDGTGANTRTTASGTTITAATVRIGSDCVDPGDGPGSYAFRTYMHETLHALGLGHPQNYGTVTDFSKSAIANDSWQMSLMSYFDQDENTVVNATKAYNLTPMLADYLALTRMYGAAAVHVGTTIYGVGSNAGGALNHAAALGARATWLIVDSAGVDLVDFSNTTAAQKIDLTAGSLSNIGGAVGNMHIAPGTQIEYATSGGGADVIIGNGAANRLISGAGNDVVQGRVGNDTIDGGVGDDRIWGEDGDDRLFGHAGNDRLYGGNGNDQLADAAGANLLDGGAGNDAVTGGTGNDLVAGGDGHDTLVGGGGLDRLAGGNGSDRLSGNDGNDTLRGGEGHDLIVGGAGNDWLVGDAGNDKLGSESGNDVLEGGAGDDILVGGTGIDRFVFSDGADTIRSYDDGADIIDLRAIAGLDNWAQLRAHLTQSTNAVLFSMGGDTLRIEAVSLAQMDAGDFIW